MMLHFRHTKCHNKKCTNQNCSCITGYGFHQLQWWSQCPNAEVNNHQEECQYYLQCSNYDEYPEPLSYPAKEAWFLSYDIRVRCRGGDDRVQGWTADRQTGCIPLLKKYIVKISDKGYEVHGTLSFKTSAKWDYFSKTVSGCLLWSPHGI